MNAAGLSGQTHLYCLLGSPVAGSMSPAMYNTCFAYHRLDAAYLVFDVPPHALADAVAGLSALGVGGFNLTMPHKTAVLPLLDALSDEAARVGAVNTVHVADGRLIGHNTDGAGFARMLSEAGIDPAGQKVVICGAGGGARAIAMRLAAAGLSALTICNRDFGRAQALEALIREHHPDCMVQVSPYCEDALATALADAMLLINATSVGMREGETLPLDARHLPERLVVSDIVYRAEPTALIRMAAERGCRTLDGLALLICQGAPAFKLWTGLEMPLGRVRARLAGVTA